MQKDIFFKIINFLLGASWAIVLFGALLTFKIFLFSGILLATFFTIFYIFFSLFFILILDALVVHKEHLEEVKKHNQLLEELLKQKENL
jgi:hypothetical protein